MTAHPLPAMVRPEADVGFSVFYYFTVAKVPGVSRQKGWVSSVT